MSPIGGVCFLDGQSVTAEERVRTAHGLETLPLRHQIAAGAFMFERGEELQHCDILPFASQQICTLEGRIDNRRELLANLRLAPSVSDSTLFLAYYQARGLTGLCDVIGEWRAAIWNQKTRTLLLATDYAGIRPLYYIRQNDRVVWSSSLRQLVDANNADYLDEQYIVDFLYGDRSVDRTPYRGVFPVPAGHAIQISPERTSFHRYWFPPVHESISFLRAEEYEEGLRNHFEDAISSRLRTSTTVSAELSGGLDSSSIVCFANQLIRDHRVDASRLTTFSYPLAGSSDLPFINAVEKHCGLPSVHIDTISYPFASSNQVGNAAPLWWQLRFDEVARRMQSIDSSLLLTGQGGDLIMGNWIDDTEQVADSLSAGAFRQALQETFAWSKALRQPVHSIFLKAAKASCLSTLPWVSGDLNSSNLIGNADNSIHSHWNNRLQEIDRERMRTALWRGAKPARRKKLWALTELLESGSLRRPEPLQHLSVSHPFMHRPLVEFMLKIPAGIVCRPGEPRYLMRRSFAGIVPAAILQRRSKATYGSVFLKSLRPLAQTLLAERDIKLVEAGYLENDSFRNRLDRFLKGMECNSFQLRTIILLEHWLRSRDDKLHHLTNKSLSTLAVAC